MIFALFLHFVHTSPDFQLVKLVQYPDALCLDGSQAALYLHQGAQTNKIIFHFRGGAWCMGNNINQTIKDCLARSKTYLGSSNTLTPTTDLSHYQHLSSDSTLNPNFHNWTKVFVYYCTGTGHQGYLKEPVEINGSKLYFKGHNVTLAALDYVQKHYKALSDKTKTFYLFGDSAGGLATFMWTDYIREMVAGTYLAFSDSGIFNDEKSVAGAYVFRQSMISLTNLVNSEVSLPNKACSSVYNGEQRYKCMMIDYLHPFIKSDFMMLQSLYDLYVAPYILGIPCVTHGVDTCTSADLVILEQHRQATLKLAKVIVSAGKNRSAFLIACSHHDLTVGTYTNPNYRVQGLTVQQAVTKYIGGEGRAGFYDEQSWPSNTGCAHLHETK